MVAPPPTLDTERLRLRAVAPADVGDVHALLSDERVVRYTLFPLFTRERAERFVRRLQEPTPPGQPPQLVFAITDRATDRVLGLAGLVLKPELEEGELWYLLHPERWGEGLVTEAARAVVSHAFGALALHRVWASCLPENPGSARVLEKIGFRREGLQRQNLRIHGEWHDSHLYATLTEEWSAGAAGDRELA